MAGGFEQRNLTTAMQIINSFFDGDVGNAYRYLDLGFKRQGQDVRYALNDDKLKALGWKPEKTFQEELPKIVKYYKNNFKW